MSPMIATRFERKPLGLSDVDPFVIAILDRALEESQFPDCIWLNGDVDQGEFVDFNDIDVFVACLINGGCE